MNVTTVKVCAVNDPTFNSLFEMLANWLDRAFAGSGFTLSILYLRCMQDATETL